MTSLIKKSFVILLMMTSSALAEIKTEVVNYKEGNTDLEGFIAIDDQVTTPRPAVLIVHQWVASVTTKKCVRR